MQSILIHTNFSHRPGVHTQWGGKFMNYTGIGYSYRQAAFAALGQINPSLIAATQDELVSAICKLDNTVTTADLTKPATILVTISVPRDIGPRKYKNGTQHPGEPEKIHPENLLAIVAPAGLSNEYLESIIKSPSTF